MINLARPLVCAVLLAAYGTERNTAPPTPPPAACAAPEFRQFDFWLGDWNVHDATGALAGTNLVTRELDGCVVQEHWVAAGTPPQRGSSFNTWVPGTRKWHQTWVDSTGGFLLLDGEMKDGVMTLGGETTGRDGRIVRHRIAWSVRPAGGIRQLWEQSRDGGQTWRVAFDGTYVRKK